MASIGEPRGALGTASRGKDVEFIVKVIGASVVEYISEGIAAFGYSPSEFCNGGVKFGRLIHRDDIDMVSEALARAIHEKRQELQMIFRIMTKAGKPRRVSARISLRRDPSGTVTHYHGILTAIA